MRMDNNQTWMVTLKMDVMSAIPFFGNSLITLSLMMSCPKGLLRVKVFVNHCIDFLGRKELDRERGLA